MPIYYLLLKKKTNQIELTDKGIEELSGAGGDKDFFIMPDIGMK